MNYDPSNPEKQTMKCPYSHRKPEDKDPHHHIPYNPQQNTKIHDNILDVIGNTPLVRLNKIPKEEGVECEILAKCEFLNPSGSMKDRIAKRMIEDAEREGKIIKNKTKLVEPSSGNTGIALALVSAVKDIPLTICMNEKMSQEKEDVMTGLGAKVIRTPGESKYLDKTSLYQQAAEISKQEDYLCLDQYTNVGNALAHYDGTGSEIVYQCDGKVDVIVVGTGTCGTMTGISRKVREANPNAKILAVDPYGSVLSMPQSLNEKKIPHDVEGIGKDFVPRNLDREIVDEWFKIGNEQSQPMARRIFQQEGMFVGGSSGAILSVAIEYAKREKLPKDARIVCLFADNVRNYLTKYLSKEWMVDKYIMDPSELVPEDHILINKEMESLNLQPIPCFDESLTLGEAIDQLEQLQLPSLPIVQNGKIGAAVPQEKLMSYIVQRNLSLNESVKTVWTKEFSSINYEQASVSAIERLLARRNVVFVQKQAQNGLQIFPVLHKNIFRLLKK